MLRFWLIGAWPVVGFSVIEIGLAIFLLRLNAQRARASELLLLTEDALRIVRTDRTAGGRKRVFRSAGSTRCWRNRPVRVPQLLLVAHGVREEIATTLGEAEKRDLWSALARLRFISCATQASTTRSCRCGTNRSPSSYASVGPIDLIRSNTRLRTAGSVMR